MQNSSIVCIDSFCIMTIAIPLTVQNEYIELMFALRSIEKYIRPPYEVLIIGDLLPEWICNVTWINVPDVKSKKQLSIRRKILAALEYADEVLFTNDDIYFLQPQDTFPYYWTGILKHHSEAGTRQLEKRLTELNKPTKHFDNHYPIVYKQDFKEASEQFPEECIIKGMYCNYHEIEGEFIADCKHNRSIAPVALKRFMQGKRCFSTGIYTMATALPILQQMFPKPSKFELK